MALKDTIEFICAVALVFIGNVFLTLRVARAAVVLMRRLLRRDVPGCKRGGLIYAPRNDGWGGGMSLLLQFRGLSLKPIYVLLNRHCEAQSTEP